jgi:hypothetical protein
LLRIATMHLDGIRVLVTDDELQHPVLHRLESRRPPQLIAKQRIFRRRHRRQHVPRLHQLLLNARHARQHLERRPQVIAPNVLARRGQLVQAQLHPQLRRLVDDDEQHLVVLERDRPLRAEDLVQAEVLAVTLRFAEVPMDLLIGKIDRTASSHIARRLVGRLIGTGHL